MVGNMHILDLILDTYILEDITRDGRERLAACGLTEIDKVRSGSYEIFLLDDPYQTGGYQLVLQRDGRDATDIVDQLNPNQPLAGPINLRLLADTIRKWTQLPKPVIISSANTEKTKQYARFLKLLKIQFLFY